MATGFLYNPFFLKHDLPSHPETAGRLTTIIQYLERHNLIRGLETFCGRPATRDELLLCHNPEMIDHCRNLKNEKLTYLDADTYITPASYEVARMAAGGLLQLVDATLSGKISNALALCRPPGHHASLTQSMGFCLFNSVAIAARYAMQEKKISRVAIIDYDVHHGNGIQETFREDPGVLYISSHGFPLYPGTGYPHETGSGEAGGTICNIPLPANSGDTIFREVYMEVAFPVLRRFHPQLILVSAGFDAHFADPLGNLNLTHTGYQWLNRELCDLASELCDGRVIFALEGGYNHQVLGAVIGNLLRLLRGSHDFDDPCGPSPVPEPQVTDLVSQLKKLHNLKGVQSIPG